MYTKYKYSFSDVLLWTRHEILVFLFFATVVTALYTLGGLHWLHIPWTPIALVGTAVAFLIGFQNNAAYGRAWEARKIWGGIINSSRTWAIMVTDMVTNEYATEKFSEAELAEHRTTLIHRHLAWLTALRHAMRVRKPWEVFMDHRTNKEWYEKVCIPERDFKLEDDLKPYLKKNEYELTVSRTNKAATLASLQSKHLRQLKESGHIWEFSFLELESVLKDLVDLQGKSERIKNFPYPRQYASIAHDFVQIFIFLLPFGVVPEFAKLGEKLAVEYPGLSDYFVWLAVPFIVVVAWVFHTMQRIGIVGENPFEGTANDVPISTIARGIEIDLREMNNESEAEIPEPYPIVHGVQM